MRSGFLVTVVAQAQDAYHTRAVVLVDAMKATLGTPDEIISTRDCESVHVEMEVVPEDGAVVLRATLDCEAPKAIKFDKNKFTAELRKHLDFSVKVTKRQIGPEEFQS